MKTYKIELTDKAKKDLYDLADYYTENDLDFYAISLFRKIYAKLNKLIIFPLAYHRYMPDPTVRYATIKHFYIFFDVNEQTKTVLILRVINQRRDLSKIKLR